MLKDNPKLIAVIAIFLGVICIGAGIYAVLNPPSEIQNTNTQQISYSTPPKNESPKPATKPKNSLVENAAYKYKGNARVYIHKEGTLYVVASEEAFLNHYGCVRDGHISNCAVIYPMPDWVTEDMISSEWIR